MIESKHMEFDKVGDTGKTEIWNILSKSSGFIVTPNGSHQKSSPNMTVSFAYRQNLPRRFVIWDLMLNGLRGPRPVLPA